MLSKDQDPAKYTWWSQEEWQVKCVNCHQTEKKSSHLFFLSSAVNSPPVSPSLTLPVSLSVSLPVASCVSWPHSASVQRVELLEEQLLVFLLVGQKLLNSEDQTHFQKIYLLKWSYLTAGE